MLRVTLNCATSLDGRLAAPDGSPLRLSDDIDWRRVHGLRVSHDAILVGIETILHDDPSLRVKQEYAHGPDPLRVVLDTHGRTPQDAQVTDGSAETLILHGPGLEVDWPACDQAEMPLKEDVLDLTAVIAYLEKRGVRSVLVEGGGTVLRAFVASGMAHVWTIYQAPVLIGGNGPQLWPGTPSGQGRRFHVENIERQGKGVLWTLRP